MLYKREIEIVCQDLDIELPVIPEVMNVDLESMMYGAVIYNKDSKGKSYIESIHMCIPKNNKYWIPRLIAHELRHVWQFQMGWLDIDWIEKTTKASGYYWRGEHYGVSYAPNNIYYHRAPWELDANQYMEDCVKRLFPDCINAHEKRIKSLNDYVPSITHEEALRLSTAFWERFIVKSEKVD